MKNHKLKIKNFAKVYVGNNDMKILEFEKMGKCLKRNFPFGSNKFVRFFMKGWKTGKKIVYYVCTKDFLILEIRKSLYVMDKLLLFTE